MASTWTVLLVAATAAHTGFQATVTLLVYPVLARTSPADWAVAHAVHSRRITPLVVVVYGAALVGCAAALAVDLRSPGVLLAALGTAFSFTLTAALAAPLHRRLGPGHDPALLTRLLRADRLRLLGAVLSLVGALLWALP